MKLYSRAIALLLVLPFLAGCDSFSGDPLADLSTTLPSAQATLTVVAASGRTVDFFKSDQGWQAVDSEQLTELAHEIDGAPDLILSNIASSVPDSFSTAGDEWGCKITKHREGHWVWHCWRDSDS
jgi:hypothetical protein